MNANYTRKNAWNDGGTFDNPDLLWYAKGVGVMQSLGLDDPNSWWFFAAIHGEYVDPNTSWYTNPPAFPNWSFIPGPPQVPTTPLPSQSLIDLYWDQCQHQSWFFPPWHRGYLIALEAQLRAAIVGLGGPSDWALPYWNYFGPDDQYEIPPAFAEKELPDGTPNPLYVEARYGPNNDSEVFIPIPPVAETCQNDTIYTGSNSETRPPGYGGPNTGFSHSGNISGNLESNPHNKVHVYVGGNAPNNDTWGLMADPGLAGLDPIFYLHHSNIDRMWAAWNAKGNSNPTDPNWLNSPASTGERKFAMPLPDGTSWVYTPAEVDSLDQLNYTYDDLAPTALPEPPSDLSRRLKSLGVATVARIAATRGDMDKEQNAELLGANAGALRVKTSGARATVRLDSGVRRKVSASIAAASEVNVPDNVYLQLENVRGTRDSYILNISINQKSAGSVALFGLRRASMADSQHGGGGLTFLVDITKVVDSLFLDNALDTDSLDVRIVPHNAIPESEDITIGRISIYRQGHQ